VRRLAAEAFRPAHFFVTPTLAVEWRHAEAEEAFWEVFQGRLLDPAHSRARRTFETWGLFQLGADEPLLGLKLDAAAGELHVVRGLDSYVWEGYDAGGNVYRSRERRKWVRELAGTLPLERFADLEEVRDELIVQLFQAVVGRRLPLSSLEAPLPAFSFGELFYCHRGPDAQGGPLTAPAQLAADVLSDRRSAPECARLLEAVFRSPAAGRPPALRAFVARWKGLGRTGADLVALLRALFNEVSLSPYTDFTEGVLDFLRSLEACGDLTPGQVVDFLAHLLRQLGRHLTAYDLVAFHHRGANYPDALLLDAVLKDYLARASAGPDLFLDAAGDGEEARRRKRLRRRALRQGWLVRRRYEGHPVPDLPTSPGENARALPPSHPRVPDEQLLQPARRRRRLYEGDPLPAPLGPPAGAALRQSAADLEHEEERRELGAALFLDRPFGAGKAPAEPDATPLLASLAYSRSVAEQRLAALAGDVGLDEAAVRRVRAGLALPGLPLEAIGPPVRPGTVSLADARRAAPDFVFLHTLPGSVRALLGQFDFAAGAGPWGAPGPLFSQRVLLARSLQGPGVTVYDEALRPRLELAPVVEGGFVRRAGQEWPAGGLRVLRVWEEESGEWRARDVRAEGVVLPPGYSGFNARRS
jgi:hypothetical protein